MRRYCFFRKLLFAITAIFVLAHPTAAYVLEGPHLLELMVNRLGKSNALAVSAKVEIQNWPQTGSAASFYEKISVGVPGMTRVDLSRDNGTGFRVRSDTEIITVVDNQIIPSKESEYDSYLDILSFRTRKMLQKRLVDHGIDISVSSVGRYKDQLVFIIGAKYPDMSKSQVWINKETFLPERWVNVTLQPAGSFKTIDVVYRNWQSFDKTWVPMAVDFYKGEERIRSISVTSVEINPVLGIGIFDIRQIKAAYPEVVQPNLFTDQPNPFEENYPVIQNNAPALNQPIGP